ncbi:MAG TPA: ankyrin repeat domain-containing protein [Nitrospiraceae bacterium]|nr:ankyrin repeat domain-containing protein [Nitrospiraceae bacterium]
MCNRPASALILILIASGLHGCSLGLLHAVDQGDSAAVSSLLSRDVDPNIQFPIVGSRPLILAAAKGHQEMVGLLLDRGAQVNAADYTGWTPLHAAIYGGHAEVVQLLLDRGADFKYAHHWYLVSPLALAESLARDSDGRKKVVDVLQSFRARLAARHPGR